MIFFWAAGFGHSMTIIQALTYSWYYKIKYKLKYMCKYRIIIKCIAMGSNLQFLVGFCIFDYKYTR